MFVATRKPFVILYILAILSMLLSPLGAKLAQAAGTFVKGINMNGDAMTIEGNAWLSYADAKTSGFSTTASKTFTSNITWSPAADSATNTMLNTVIYQSGSGFTMTQTIANGSYDVYFWLTENYANNARKVDIKVEGAIVATGVGAMNKNTWVKYGPYAATVTDGALNVDFVRISGDPQVAGMAIFSSDTITPTHTPTPFSTACDYPGACTNIPTITSTPTKTATPTPTFTQGTGKDGWATIQAESYNTSTGSLQVCSGATGQIICYVGANSSVQFNGIDLRGSSIKVDLSVANGGGNTNIQVWVGGVNVATLTVGGTGGWGTYQTKSITIPSQSGVKDVKLVFVNGNINVDWLVFAAAGTPTPTYTPTPTNTPGTPSSTLPSSYQWSSSGVLISPKPDSSHSLKGIKDPSVVYSGGKWHVFASTASETQGYNMVYMNFTDWSQAASATHYYLDQSPIGAGYRAAPEVFYFAPQNLWYLIYQTGNASYSTNPDISNPNGWSAPKHFYSGMPAIIQQNIGSGYWVDMWVICDSANCYLFSSDDNGHLYRSQTSLSNFPNGMSQPVIAMQDSNKANLYEASNVYKVQGRSQYLMLIEAIGSDGRRWFRSWTSSSIAGPWTALADTESNPFIRSNNVTFSGAAWTRDFSHGEMIRAGTDQTLTISPCNIRYLYQGMDPNASASYNDLPWRLALVTQSNSTCTSP